MGPPSSNPQREDSPDLPATVASYTSRWHPDCWPAYCRVQPPEHVEREALQMLAEQESDEELDTQWEDEVIEQRNNVRAKIRKSASQKEYYAFNRDKILSRVKEYQKSKKGSSKDPEVIQQARLRHRAAQKRYRERMGTSLAEKERMRRAEKKRLQLIDKGETFKEKHPEYMDAHLSHNEK
ncbi:hypothetical protein V5O48_008470 [Marasmius crinis-equi]|uniref:Uncharacterized protein n=1 Tax=Marasmius crinis-equi TaxID=585013 RepID=A0ABR3FDT9_9AGAR